MHNKNKNTNIERWICSSTSSGSQTINETPLPQMGSTS